MEDTQQNRISKAHFGSLRGTSINKGTESHQSSNFGQFLPNGASSVGGAHRIAQKKKG